MLHAEAQLTLPSDVVCSLIIFVSFLSCLHLLPEGGGAAFSM